jgi:hypothetical protein
MGVALPQQDIDRRHPDGFVDLRIPGPATPTRGRLAAFHGHCLTSKTLSFLKDN